MSFRVADSKIVFLFQLLSTEYLCFQVMAFGLKDRASSYTEFPIKFKIHSPDRRIATKKAQYVILSCNLCREKTFFFNDNSVYK